MSDVKQNGYSIDGNVELYINGELIGTMHDATFGAAPEKADAGDGCGVLGCDLCDETDLGASTASLAGSDDVANAYPYTSANDSPLSPLGCDLCDETDLGASTASLAGSDDVANAYPYTSANDSPLSPERLIDDMLATEFATTVGEALPGIEEGAIFQQAYDKNGRSYGLEMAYNGVPVPELVNAIREVLDQREAFAVHARMGIRTCGTLMDSLSRLSVRFMELAAEFDVVSDELADMTAERDRIESERDKANGELANVNKFLAAYGLLGAAERLDDMTRELNTLRGIRTTHDIAVSDLNGVRAENAGLYGVIRDLQAERDALRVDRATVENARDAYRAQVQDLLDSHLTVIRFASGREITVEGTPSEAGLVQMIHRAIDADENGDSDGEKADPAEDDLPQRGYVLNGCGPQQTATFGHGVDLNDPALPSGTYYVPADQGYRPDWIRNARPPVENVSDVDWTDNSAQSGGISIRNTGPEKIVIRMEDGRLVIDANSVAVEATHVEAELYSKAALEITRA
jgi:hypothetical protein